MSKFLKILTLAAVGVAIGTVAGKLVKTDKIRFPKKKKPAISQDNLLKSETGKKDRNNDLDDLENCFI
jgi:hypothetical protein